MVGNRTKVKIVKNKMAAPFREAEFVFDEARGFQRGRSESISPLRTISWRKSGSWFSYGGERIGQGRENARQFLKENKDIAAKIETEVRKALGLISVEEKAQAAAANAEAAPQCDAQAVRRGGK